ncbi:hypothetical protein [Leptospira noguchii]|nr:hypothetical protein [Leptospira noguchii]UOG53695.1 hypothetical protein MAL09_06025 [Leptospira noguchii]
MKLKRTLPELSISLLLALEVTQQTPIGVYVLGQAYVVLNKNKSSLSV